MADPTFVASYARTGASNIAPITVPGAVAEGDLGFILVGQDDNSINITVEPSGWTTLFSQVAGNSSWRLYSRVRQAGDTSSIAITITGTVSAVWYRNAELGTVGTPWVRSSTSASITCPEVTRTVTGSMLLAIGCDRSIAATAGEQGYASVTGATFARMFEGDPTLSAGVYICASYHAEIAPASAIGDVAWTLNDTSGNAFGFQIELTPIAASLINVYRWDGAAEEQGYVTVWDGASETPVTEVRPMMAGYPTVTGMLALPEFYIAHRGGSANWPEMSLHAYTQSVDWGSAGALEISVARTSDGVFFGLHDQNLQRTSPEAPATNASSLTWAQVQGYTIVATATTDPAQARQPYMRLEEILAVYAPHFVLFFDPKYVSQSYWGDMWDLILSYTTAGRVVGKYFYTAQSFANDCAARGIDTWGYLYQADIGNLNTYYAPWTMLGMEYGATQGTWDTVLAKSKPVIAHICATQGNIDTGLARGAAGCMVSGILSMARRIEL